jgi:hypothetical protein
MGVTYNSRKTHQFAQNSSWLHLGRTDSRALPSGVSDSLYANESGIQEACYQSAIRLRVKEIDATGSHFSSVSAHA